MAEPATCPTRQVSFAIKRGYWKGAADDKSFSFSDVYASDSLYTAAYVTSVTSHAVHRTGAGTCVHATGMRSLSLTDVHVTLAISLTGDCYGGPLLFSDTAPHTPDRSQVRPAHLRGRALLRGARVVGLHGDRRPVDLRLGGVPRVRAGQGASREAHAVTATETQPPIGIRRRCPADEKRSRRCAGRLTVKPKAALTRDDVHALLSLHYEGTALSPFLDVGAGAEHSPYRWNGLEWKYGGKTCATQSFNETH